MKIKIVRPIILIFLFWITLHSFIFAQEKTVHDIKFLKAKVMDSINKKDVLVLFHVSAKDPEDFPPVISMRMTYSVNDER